MEEALCGRETRLRKKKRRVERERRSEGDVEIRSPIEFFFFASSSFPYHRGNKAHALSREALLAGPGAHLRGSGDDLRRGRGRGRHFFFCFCFLSSIEIVGQQHSGPARVVSLRRIFHDKRESVLSRLPPLLEVLFLSLLTANKMDFYGSSSDDDEGVSS